MPCGLNENVKLYQGPNHGSSSVELFPNQNVFAFGEKAVFRRGVFKDKNSKPSPKFQRLLVKVFVSNDDAEFEFWIHQHLYKQGPNMGIFHMFLLPSSMFIRGTFVAYQEPSRGTVSTLQKRIDSKSLHSPNLRLRFALCIAHALCNIKKANVVHGNVVAANIVVFKTQRGFEIAKLTGFNRMSSRVIQYPLHQHPNLHIGFQNDLKQFGHLLSSILYPTGFSLDE